MRASRRAGGHKEIGFAAESFDTWLRIEPGDRAVHVPPREGSYFFDGFFRVYRNVDATWLSIAGD